jgi:PIN domain nuclease of toxin-antitoxin system
MNLLLDTHVLIWLDAGSGRLSANALSTIDRALSEQTLWVSAVSFWEIGMLIEKGRLTLSLPLTQWRLELLSKGLKELPVNGSIAIDSTCFQLFHGDPMDRLITASAIHLSATLVTADNKILAWADQRCSVMDAAH